MKTISGKPISEKPISLSKATKILSKFVSAENGASRAISAYLYRASSSFSELNQLHKELKLPRSNRKHKSSRSKNRDGKEKIDKNYIQSVEINEEMNHWSVHQFGSKNPIEDAKKSSQTTVKFKQEPDEAAEYDAGTEGGSEWLKKKKKKHSIKLQEQGDHGVKVEEVEANHKLLAEAANENEEKPAHGGLDFSQEPLEREERKKKKKHEDEHSEHVVDEVKLEVGSNKRNAGGDNKKGLEEGKKHRKEKKKKDKDAMNNLSDKKGGVIKPEDEIASRKDDRREITENRNGDSVDLKESLNKKKKRRMAGSEDKINTDEVKVHKIRKNEDVEGREYDKYGEPTKKKIKKKHGGGDE